MTMKPPPPSPHEKGSATPRTPAAVTAASTAFPPRFSASIAACVARASTLAAAPPVPVDVAGPEGATAAAATPISVRNERTSAAAKRNLPMVYPFRIANSYLPDPSLSNHQPAAAYASAPLTFRRPPHADQAADPLLLPRPPRKQNRPLPGGFGAGATGLEPATSGVTVLPLECP